MRFLIIFLITFFIFQGTPVAEELNAEGKVPAGDPDFWGGEIEHFANATILYVSPRPPFASGVIAWWVTLGVSAPELDTPGEPVMVLYLIYFGEEQPIPPIDSLCSITTQEHYINGLTGNGEPVDRSRPLRVVQEMTCDGIQYSPNF